MRHYAYISSNPRNSIVLLSLLEDLTNYSRINVNVRPDGHVDKTDSEDEEVGAVVDGVGDESRLNLPQDCEVSSVGVGLHHG